jgi:asparagine synthase (glutamine-hydrolysing)
VLVRAWEAWGPDALARYNGMFAFGLWDATHRTLVLARDRAGIKPLFYASGPHGVVFASEMKALLRATGVSDAVDPIALAEYFTLGYVSGARTVYRDIRKLPPGHYAVWRDSGGLDVRRYWEPPAARETASLGVESDRLADLILAAVRRQLVSDVPLGAFLSGGVDSSVIVAAMRAVEAPTIRTFSVGFEGMGLYDERPYARRIAQRFGTDHTEEVVSPRPASDVERIVAAFDEPFADSSAIPTYYVAAMARRAVTVALSGTGADDIFGGYRRHASAGLRATLARLPAPAFRAVAAAARWLPAGRRTAARQAALFLQRATAVSPHDDAEWYAGLVSVFDDAVLRELAPSVPSIRHPIAARVRELAGGAAERFMRADFETYLPDDILVKEDRMSMSWGLEVRVPFLDNELLDFAASLPTALKVRRMTTKHVLKHVAARWLPRDIVSRPKHGFAVPVSEWLSGVMRELARATLLDGDPGVLDRRRVEALWHAHQQGIDCGAQLWTLFVYRLWHRRQRETAVAVDVPPLHSIAGTR